MHRACMGLRFLRACLWDREWIGGSAAGAEKSGFAVLLFFGVKRDAGYACRLPERFPYEKMMQESFILLFAGPSNDKMFLR